MCRTTKSSCGHKLISDWHSKTGHKSWNRDKIPQSWINDRIVQFYTQQTVAERCKLGYVIAVNNKWGAIGLKKHIIGFPIRYVPTAVSE